MFGSIVRLWLSFDFLMVGLTFLFSIQAMQCNPAKQSSWNMLSLFTNSGMLFLEISLVAFLLKGNHATGPDALARTFIVSGVIVAADMLLKVCFLFSNIWDLMNIQGCMFSFAIRTGLYFILCFDLDSGPLWWYLCLHWLQFVNSVNGVSLSHGWFPHLKTK